MVFMIGIEFIPLSNRGIEMKIIPTDNSASVRSLLARSARKSRGAWEGIQFGSPEHFCNQVLENERFEKQN